MNDVANRPADDDLDTPDYAVAIVKTLREPLVVLDGQVRVKEASAAFYRVFNVAPDKTVGRLLYELGDGQWDIPALREKLEDLLRNGHAFFDDFEVDHDFPGVGQRTMLLNARRIPEIGETKLILLAIDDISARRRTERRLAEQARLLNLSHDAIIVRDVNNRVTYWNQGAEQVFGYTRGEAVGQDLHTLLKTEFEHPFEELVAELRENRRMIGEVIQYAKDGRRVVMLCRWSLDHDAQGKPASILTTATDMTERKQIEQAKDRLAAIVESSNDAILSKDLDGIMTSWNRGAQQLFGYTAQEAIGRTGTMLFPPDLLDDEPRIMERIRRGERIESYETIRLRKDGTRLDIALTVSPIFDSQGRIVGASKIARDISERKRVEEALRQSEIHERKAKQEAEAASRAKDVFLATLSHELRTPLNAILGWSTLLQGKGVSADDLKEGMEVIRRNCKAQAQLIDDIMDVSRIVSGKLRLNISSCDLTAALHAALDVVQPAADAKGIELIAELDPAANEGSCDAARLQQVVWNLLTNAVNFTPKGGTVRLTLSREDSTTRITVSDTGRGITKEFLPHVFERFRQADGSTKRTVGGLGLGLSIAKHIVEMHGGKIRAQSAGENPPSGSTFTVELPISAVRASSGQDEDETGEDQPYRATPPDAGQASGGRRPLAGPTVRIDGLRVMVVDDEPDARTMLAKVLERAGATVTVAGGFQEALDAIGVVGASHDLLVSDIGMPERDGYDLIRSLRSAGHTVERLPAVALTGFAAREDERRALLAGFQVHISKPVQPHELLAVAASLTGRGKA